MSLGSYSRILRSAQAIHTSPTPLSWTTRNHHNVDHRASSKLFADSEHEELTKRALASAASPRTAIQGTASEHPNWTGDESIEDAVLRMLVDKYKPLRTGTIQTAEEKMHRALPQVTTHQPALLPTSMSENPSDIPPTSPLRVYRADEPLLPAVEGHKPWLTTFKVPSHATASIRYGHFPAIRSASPSMSSTRSGAQVGLAEDDRARRKEREVKQRTEIAGRLIRAKESTLNHRLGITKSIKGSVQARPNPVSIKGWAGLIEERIERARREGQFRTIKGRGKPFERGTEDHNPFIAREEFLMNRIVQRQGAAPPWVEIQLELEAAVATFRSVLKQSWVRRAVRMLTLSHRPLGELSLADAQTLRDREWEAREKAYHESALAEVNALVRKYNAVAPYAVRRAYYVLDVELGRTFEESGEDILLELGTRHRGSGAGNPTGSKMGVDDGEGKLADAGARSPGNILRLRDLFWEWFRRRRMTRRWRRPAS